MVAKKDSTPQLMPDRLKSVEHAQQCWFIVVEPNTTREQINAPMFWAHVSRKLKPYDHLRIASDDGAFYAEALVLACDRTWARVHILDWQALTTADVSQTQSAMEQFQIQFKGPKKLHCVVRIEDGEVIHEGSQTKADAQKWLEERKELLTAA